jgi:hypothetical protein
MERSVEDREIEAFRRQRETIKVAFDDREPIGIMAGSPQAIALVIENIYRNWPVAPNREAVR